MNLEHVNITTTPLGRPYRDVQSLLAVPYTSLAVAISRCKDCQSSIWEDVTYCITTSCTKHGWQASIEYRFGELRSIPSPSHAGTPAYRISRQSHQSLLIGPKL